MGTNGLMALSPRYMQSFQCTGSACEDTCCSGWRVSVDKAAYRKYRDVHTQPMASRLREHVIKVDKPGNRVFARIQLDEQQNCHFLADDKLCDIQRQLGADHLSSTCAQYPRQYARAGTALTLHASLSCPEAARLALENAQAMDPLPMELPFNCVDAVPLIIDLLHPDPQSHAVRLHAALIRESFGAIIRFEGLTASEAMVVMGIIVRRMVQTITEAATAKEGRGVPPQVLARFLDPEFLAAARSNIAAIATPRRAQMLLLQEITRNYLHEFHGLPRFRQQIEEAMEGLASQGGTAQEMEVCYDDADRQWFTPFDQKHPYILKNYLLNDLGKSLFPRQDAAGLEDEFMQVAIRFSLIKMYLVGLSAKYGDAFDQTHCIRLISTFVRNIEHNGKFMPMVMKQLQAGGFSNLATLTTLVK